MNPSTYQPCCPPFDPVRWDARTHLWQEKRFITDQVRLLFHIPLNIGRVIQRMWKKVQAAEAALPSEEGLILAYDPSPWRSELFMTVAREVPGAENVTLSGEFVSKVYEGPYHHVPRWFKDMDQFLAAQGKQATRYYVHFASCPKCAQHYGKNYAVVFAQVT